MVKALFMCERSIEIGFQVFKWGFLMQYLRFIFKESLYGKVKIALYIDSIWQKKLFSTSTNWWLLKNRYIAILKSISYQGQGDILHQIERYLQWRIYEILIFFDDTS